MESITQWDPNRVHQWMASIGFPNYEKQIKGKAAAVCSFLTLTKDTTGNPFLLMTIVLILPFFIHAASDNAISGDLLVHLDHAALKDLSVWEVGKRLFILKAIYQLKVSYGISLEAGDYVPPSKPLESTTVLSRLIRLT